MFLSGFQEYELVLRTATTAHRVTLPAGVQHRRRTWLVEDTVSFDCEPEGEDEVANVARGDLVPTWPKLYIPWMTTVRCIDSLESLLSILNVC